MQAGGLVRKLYLLSVVFPLMFLLIFSPFSTTVAQNGLREQPISSSVAGDPTQSSLENSDLPATAQPSASLDPQAQAATDAARASLEGNSSLSGTVYPATISSATWANRSPANPPFARRSHALAYDASAGKVILFGGTNGNIVFNDTWAYNYNANSWTNRYPANAPLTRRGHALSYDASAGKVILFGGLGWDGIPINDTWAYDYSTNSWTNRNPTKPPPTPSSHALAYDASAGKVILFGGRNGINLLNDTWAYDYSTNSWTNRNPAIPLPARAEHALAYDASAGKVILFGGIGWGGSDLNDTWAYNYASNSWSNRNPASPPLARNSHALAYDVSAGKVILFGGLMSGSGYLNGTWAYDYASNSWTNRTPTSSPPSRSNHALAYDASAGKVILFGGWDGNNSLNDTWAYDSATAAPALHLQPGWNLISLPLITSPAPATVFANLPAGWVLYAWDAVNSRYLGGGQVSLAPGVGYWLKLPGSTPLDYPLTGSPVADNSFLVPLSNGWNLVGAPYNANVAWGNVRLRYLGNDYTLPDAVNQNYIAGAVYYWTGTSYGNAAGGNFEPGRGYWLRAKMSGCNLVFPRP